MIIALSDNQTEAAAEALGMSAEDMTQEQLLSHVNAFVGDSLADLKAHLAALEADFESAGGRGVGMADQIDGLRVAVAVRETPPLGEVYCADNDCGRPTCHRCFPRLGCRRHEKCVDATKNGTGNPEDDDGNLTD